MTTQTPVRAPKSNRLSVKEILTIAVLAVVFGFLYWVLVQAWRALSVAMGPLGDLTQNILIGGWMVVAPIALYITRRPGSGIAAELLAAVVEFAFLGNPVGPIVLLSGLIQGVGAEVAFALTRYRRFGLPVFLASGVTAAVANFCYATIRFGWLGQDLFGVRIVLQLASGLLLCGLLGWVISKALLATGVLRDLPAGRAAQDG